MSDALREQWRREADENIKRWIAETRFLVEADDFAYHALWRQFAGTAQMEAPGSRRRRVAWEQLNPGFGEQVGTLDGRPVCVAVIFARLRGSVVAFYYATSEVVDHKQIEAWVWRTFSPPKWDSGTRRAHCNAMNFHHCLNALESP